MNTNEDLRTFRDGVLIWATTDSENNLVINKVGTPVLDSTNDHSSYVLSTNDLYDNEGQKIYEEDIGKIGNEERIYSYGKSIKFVFRSLILSIMFIII